MRGYYCSLKEMARDGLPVNTFVAKNGVFEVRITEAGIFTVKINDEKAGYEELDEGFEFRKPLTRIPWTVLQQVIAFFKHYSKDNYEAMAYIMWDREAKKYFVYVPEQKTTAWDVDAERQVDMALKHVYVMKIHSHHTMPAKFSSIDDEEEVETMLYAVVGRLDNYLPDITVRYSCGGHHREIPAREVFESPFTQFPADWLEKIKTGGES
jgi:PRTRC genetic system protein A